MDRIRQSRAGATRRGAVAAGIVAVLGAATLAATPAHAQSRIPARPSSSHFVQTATSGNVGGDWTAINSATTNGDPAAVIFVTEDITNGFADAHPYGVYYQGPEWAIFNEDGAAMPVGAQFFVLAFSGSSATDFVVTSTLSSVSGDTTFINSSKTNGKASVQLQVTQNWNPGGVGDVYNAHNPGVWYDGHQWGVFNEDVADMQVGASFNVLVGKTGATGASLALQKVTSSNISGNATYVSNSHLNGDANAITLVTSNYNPGHHGGTYDNSPLSIGYSSVFSQWDVQDRVGFMHVHMAFNLLIFSS